MNIPDRENAAASRYGEYARPNVFEIDLGAVARCTRAIRAAIGVQTYFFATLKADAYGYGVLPVARAVLAAGADALSLVGLDDAIRLRESGIRAPILVYAGSVPGKNVVAAYETYDLIATLHSDESLAAFAAYATREIKVAVKVEVGPERIGITAEQAAAYVKSIAWHPKLRMHVLNGHPSVPAKGQLEASLAWQYSRFVGVCEELERAGVKVPYKAVASSKVLRMTGKSMLLNAADPGAALFSALDPGNVGEQYQPFRALKSRLIQVRDVSRAEFLDEAPFKIVSGMRVGVIPIGYSDGMHRLHCGEVLVRGKRVAILAAPALEYTRVDLTRVPDAIVGDEVVIIGAQNGVAIRPEEVVNKQAAARVSDLALEVRPSVARVYLAGE
jgi:alanine racemase